MGAPVTTSNGPNLSDLVKQKPNVYEALARVIAQLPPIAKDQEMKAENRQGRSRGPSYRYRGIEQIKGATQRIMAQEGVVYAPRAKLLDIRPASPEGWQDFIVQFDWIVKGPAGDTYRDDEGRLPRTIGVGRDNSDKGANKAHSQAEKYLLVSLLQIGDQEEPDAHGDYGAQAAADQAATVDPGDLYIPAEEAERIRGLAKDLSEEAKAMLRARWAEPGLPTEEGHAAIRLLRVRQVADVEALIAECRTAAESAAQKPPDGSTGTTTPPPAPGAQESAEEPGVGVDLDAIREANEASVANMPLGEVREVLGDLELPSGGAGASIRKRLIEAWTLRDARAEVGKGE